MNEELGWLYHKFGKVKKHYVPYEKRRGVTQLQLQSHS